MKKMRKALAAIVVFALLAASIVGCAIDEIAVIDAFIKTSQITTYEGTTKLEISFSGESESEELQEVFNTVAAYLSGFSLVVNDKYWSNEEMTKVKYNANFDLEMGDVGGKIDFWMETDQTGEGSFMKLILKVPPVLADTYLDGQYAGKYIVLDFDSFYEELGIDMSFANSTNQTKEIIEKMYDFIKSTAEDFEPGMKVITKKGNTTSANGESVTEYEISLNDASFKNLLHSFINDAILQKSTMDFVKEYLEDSTSIFEDQDIDEVMDEFDQYIDLLAEELPAFREKVSEVFEKFKDIKILGDEGIKVSYYINSDGYIVEQKCSVDIEINIAGISEAFGIDVEGEEGIIRLGVKYHSSIDKINQDVLVDMPQITAENSVNLFDEFSGIFGAYETEFPVPTVEDGINVLINWEYVDFPDVIPQNIDGRVLVPIRTISEEMGAEVLYNHETKLVTIIKDEKVIKLTIGEAEAFVNDEVVNLDVPAMIIGGRTMVPVRFVSENMDAYVEWDGDTQTVIIIY
ncbi:UNVERIFIED_CONTAM: copper amine oxidase-like protein [Acetivibrio alkalicellulosi]